MSSQLKSTFTLLLILTISGVVLSQMGLYLVHFLFGWEFASFNLFQYCLNLIEDGVSSHVVVNLILNMLIVYTFLYVFWYIAKQAILIYRINKKWNGMKNYVLSDVLNQLYSHSKRKITVMNANNPFAFTMGFFRPHIVISTGLLDMLETDEVEAVILHETHHLQHFDPLKIFLVTLLSEVMWYVPFTKHLAHDYKTLRELLADQYAIRKMGTSEHLGRALLKLAKNAPSRFNVMAVSVTETTINYRIKQLLDPDRPVRLPVLVKPKPLVVSTISLLILISMVLGGCA